MTQKISPLLSKCYFARKSRAYFSKEIAMKMAMSIKVGKYFASLNCLQPAYYPNNYNDMYVPTLYLNNGKISFSIGEWEWNYSEKKWILVLLAGSVHNKDMKNIVFSVEQFLASFPPDQCI
jgi:hypothetical protein